MHFGLPEMVGFVERFFLKVNLGYIKVLHNLLLYYIIKYLIK